MALSLSTFLLPRPKQVARAISARFSPAAIDVDQVSNILLHYGLESTAAPKSVATGRRNLNLVLSTTGGPKVLRQYRAGWPLPTVANEHSILNRLAELEFPAPRGYFQAVSSGSGSSQTRRGYRGAIQKFRQLS